MGNVNELKDFTRGQLDAALMKIGQDVGMGTAEGIKALLSGRLVVSEPTRNWREQDDIIYLSVTSYGTTGPEWIKRLEEKGFRVRDYARSVLHSPDFKPISGMTTEIAILKGTLFEDHNRITSNIRDLAARRKLTTPNAEVACLIRENFSDKQLEQMGLWYIVTMHEPIKDSGGGPALLVSRREGGGRWLSADYVGPGGYWLGRGGFAFAVPQVSSQN